MKSILQTRVRDFVAWQLEHYYQSKRQLEEIEICSPVYARQLEHTVAAIDRIVGKLDETDAQLIALVYFRGSYTVSGAAELVGLSQTAAYNHINKILTAIALELGLINVGY